MFDNADLIAAAFNGAGDLGGEAGEAVDQRRNLPREADGVAKGPRREAAAVRGQIDHGYAANQTGGHVLRGMRAPGWRKTMRSTSCDCAR